MFTGLIETMGEVVQVESNRGNLLLTIRAGFTSELKVDQSVSVDGACQTVVKIAQDTFSVVVIEETLQRTTLRELRSGEKVHLERAMSVNGRLDGHIVQGHVDGIAQVIRTEERDGSRWIWLRAPETYAKYIVEKGSVALAGISLTVAARRGALEFAVAIIPHTSSNTNVVNWRSGSRVNLETDVLAKYVERLLLAR